MFFVVIKNTKELGIALVDVRIFHHPSTQHSTQPQCKQYVTVIAFALGEQGSPRAMARTTCIAVVCCAVAVLTDDEKILSTTLATLDCPAVPVICHFL